MLLSVCGLRTALGDGIHWEEKGQAVFGIHNSPSAFGQSPIIQVALKGKECWEICYLSGYLVLSNIMKENFVPHWSFQRRDSHFD